MVANITSDKHCRWKLQTLMKFLVLPFNQHNSFFPFHFRIIHNCNKYSFLCKCQTKCFTCASNKGESWENIVLRNTSPRNFLYLVKNNPSNQSQTLERDKAQESRCSWKGLKPIYIEQTVYHWLIKTEADFMANRWLNSNYFISFSPLFLALTSHLYEKIEIRWKKVN